MPHSWTRRNLLLAGATSGAVASAGQQDDLAGRELERAIAARHDYAVRDLLRRQVADATSPWRGSFADSTELCFPGPAAGAVELFMAAYLHPASRFHREAVLVERMRLAVGFLERSQNPEGNLDLPITNFNSPPDTAFCVNHVATAALLARRAGQAELAKLPERFLRRAMEGLLRGGVHTPNHRWVVCSALAQLWELYREPACLGRIEQWLAEGIDIDTDGQYSERSTLIYNSVTNRALIIMAAKLGRDELLEPVRQNLNSLLYLLHPDGEVVTEISRRQDQYLRGDAASYWFALQYLALRDGDGRFAALARRYFPRQAYLSTIMEFPELLRPLPPQTPLPTDYERLFPALGIARIRRGALSATIFLRGQSRFLHMRRGAAVVEAVRMASAFFGKGQFVPQRGEKRGGSYQLEQTLEGDYLQPLDPPRRIDPEDWASSRSQRRRTQVCTLTQRATVSETASGFRLRLEVRGTERVPVAVEINLRPGGRLEGAEAAPGVSDAWLFHGGEVRYRVGADTLAIGPGLREHAYTQVRLAEPKLQGPSLYLTGYSPLDHTVEFRWETA
ncbi:MAG: hypothetical protein NZ554_08870 [Bryobacteraceae bacterium]|nr:hypothetical protein [Bryobacteraceae bacterium]